MQHKISPRPFVLQRLGTPISIVANGTRGKIKLVRSQQSLAASNAPELPQPVARETEQRS